MPLKKLAPHSTASLPTLETVVNNFIINEDPQEISRDLQTLLLEYLQQEATRQAMPTADLFGNIQAVLKFLNALADCQEKGECI